MHNLTPHLRLALCAALLSACGAKTGLPVPDPVDASVDSPTDVRFDVPVRDVFVEDAFIPEPDVCIELPIDEPPRFVDVSFIARISTADVLFLVDVTGSMGDEIEQIRGTLRDVVAPGLAESIDDVWLSVAEFADFPVRPYGDPGSDVPFRLRQASTMDVGAAQRGVTNLAERSGADGPESHTEALWQAATGAGIPGTLPPARCAAGQVGYPCFRETGSRIILLFTDAEFHNGPGGSNPYALGDIRPAPATYDQTVGALRSIGAKVLGLFSGGGEGDPAYAHLRAIAQDTGAVTPDGEPIVVDIGSRGERLGAGVIDVVRTLVEEVPIDVDALVEDYPFDGFDALQFVTGVRTLAARPAGGAIDRGDRFDAVRPGTQVSFRVELNNDLIERGPEPQSYYMTVVLRGDGATRLTETFVQVVIPSIPGEGCPTL